MEELLELRTCIEQQRYQEALLLIGEMEEMSKEDKINKIHNFMVILLLHLIKQQVEKRSTRSWELSILTAVKNIQRINKRRKAGGHYLTLAELQEVIAEEYPLALKAAALETFEGQYTDEQLSKQVSQAEIEQQALEMIEV